MAPNRTPRGKNRDNYFNPGVQGRKTGVTLKDTGVRDEHGLEIIDGIFSSPEKPTTRRAKREANVTLTEDDMDLGESTMPDPTEVLTGRKLAQNRPSLPPPKGRSPIKTHLNSPARRQSSMGPLSSPLRQLNATTPGRSASHPTVNRRLDFSMNEPRQSVEHTPSLPGTHALRGTPRSTRHAAGSSLAPEGVPELQPSPIMEERTGPLEESTEEDEQGNDELVGISGDFAEDEEMQMVDGGDDDLGPEQEDGIPEATSPPVKRRGPTSKNKAQSSPGNQRKVPQAAVPAKKRGKGRPPSRPDIQPVYRDNEVSEEEEMLPASKRRRSNGAGPSGTTTRGGRGKGRKAPTQRDANVQMSNTRQREAVDEYVKNEVARRGPNKPRSLVILRRGTPDADSGATTTRSGRTSIKPLAYWRNERVVYGEANDLPVGQRYYLPTIKEIIRTEEVDPPRRKRQKKIKASRKKRAESDLEDDEEDEEDDVAEPWEVESGTVTGTVRPWDHEMEAAVESQDEEQEIAYSTNAMETREVANATFRYAKTLSLPFFGSGLVDLPPGAVKKPKNSRKMQMVFFVYTGKVMVDVAGTKFRISKGGMWQVPRGNFYSITNDYDEPARLFFAQGNEIIPQWVDQDEVAVTRSY